MHQVFNELPHNLYWDLRQFQHGPMYVARCTTRETLISDVTYWAERQLQRMAQPAIHYIPLSLLARQQCRDWAERIVLEQWPDATEFFNSVQPLANN